MTTAKNKTKKAGSTLRMFRVAAFVAAGVLLSACGAQVPGSASGPAAVPAAVPAKAMGVAPGGHLDAGKSSGSVGTQGSAGGATVRLASGSVPLRTVVKPKPIDVVKVSKCYTNATAKGGGVMLIKAKSSDPKAKLSAYRPNGTLIGVVQNGGGSRYGGTVMPYQHYNPMKVTIRSSSGGRITVPTTAFQVQP